MCKRKKILKVKLTGIRMESFKQHLVPLYYTLTTIELLCRMGASASSNYWLQK